MKAKKAPNPRFIPRDHLVSESREFREWLGDSTIKDDVGRPQVMYHGTYLDFDSFDSRHHFHSFTVDPALAESHARDSYWQFRNDPGGAAIVIMPVFLRVVRPFDPRKAECAILMGKWGLGDPGKYDYAEWEGLEDLEIIGRIESLGFDGIWMCEAKSYDTLAVFDPRQVKSAIGNSGRFESGSLSLTDPVDHHAESKALAFHAGPCLGDSAVSPTKPT